MNHAFPGIGTILIIYYTHDYQCVIIFVYIYGLFMYITGVSRVAREGFEISMMDKKPNFSNVVMKPTPTIPNMYLDKYGFRLKLVSTQTILLINVYYLG